MLYIIFLIVFELSNSAHVDRMQPIEEWTAYAIVQDGIVTHHPISFLNDSTIQFEKIYNNKMYIKILTKNLINIDSVVLVYSNYTKEYEINIIEDDYIKIKLDDDLNIGDLTEIYLIGFELSIKSYIPEIVKHIYNLYYSAVKRYYIPVK